MKISEMLRSGAAPFPSLEIVPPMSGISKEQLLDSIAPLMEFAPRYINVTTHRDEFRFDPQPDGSYIRRVVRNRVSAVAVCAAIQAQWQVEVVPHLICGGTSAYETEALLQDLKFLGIENVMALRGDSLTGEKRFTPDPAGFSHANELVAAIRGFERENGGDFCIGVGGYPEKHFEAANPETDIAFLKQKVDAGADLVITQMFFDNAVFYRFVDRCRAAGIRVPIIPGLKPISTARQITLLPEAFSIDIPVELTEAIRCAGDDKEAVYRLGTDWCIAQCRDLLAHGVPAVHFYTMGKSRNIAEILRECF
ncbi:MAG: methylenetetrahydrofolate reductase [Bacteroidales bacterium]|nr:methylenetetrahydrofolate reductase [NAD(P)H] [Bacteroidales bacterium]MBR3484816.1 methylenetetrahydrofolate reductase [NAD(P)H] [Bacteroidales bacterium]